MDKNAIKKYAIWARNELIARVSQKALLYGITKNNMVDAAADSVGGKLLTDTEKKQRQALITQIKEKGFEQVIEEVAYTWFNRFSALRFMEVNGYLPTHVRVFTDEENNFKPQIITEAIHLEMDGLDMEKVYAFKEADKTEELYKYLLITQCNALNKILPGMFQRISDYTELLLPDNILREGSVIEQMIVLIPEDDWKDAVQIIGWLYQYYNTEPKDKLINAKKQYKNKDIPFVTQLFTSDWIVRYMVQNSLGRVWLEGHEDNTLKGKWEFYIEDGQQTEELQDVKTYYQTLTPEMLTCIDPCMGSGHILAYAFDIFMQIYEAYGYSSKEAVECIVKNNIYGLDIDERATQLAYFALMMKARQYDRRFFIRGIQPHVYRIIDSNEIDSMCLEYFIDGRKDLEYEMEQVCKSMKNANEYGSILSVPNVDFEKLYSRIEKIREDINIFAEVTVSQILPFIQSAELLSRKYELVISNPPYMAAKYMTPNLKEYVSTNYAEYKADLFATFIVRFSRMCTENGQIGVLTPYVWMFIQSYEKLREYIYNNMTFSSIVQLEFNAFEAACVPVAAFTFRNKVTDISFESIRLSEFKGIEVQEPKTREAVKWKNCGYRYTAHQKDFEKIPGAPVAYWASKELFDAFAHSKLGDLSEPRQGMTTSDNNRFLRMWPEVCFDRIKFDAHNLDEAKKSGYKWFPYNKGGGYRKWYGNNEYIVNYENDGAEMKAFHAELNKTSSGGRIKNQEYYFRDSITWTFIAITPGFRNCSYGFIFDVAGSSLFIDANLKTYTLGFLCSNTAKYILGILNPTMNIQANDIKALPLIIDEDKKKTIESLVKENISISKDDWDFIENSWDFLQHPLISGKGLIKDKYDEWINVCEKRYKDLIVNETKLNEIFISIYGLQDVLKADVNIDDVTIQRADIEREIKGLISYAVGCMFGRYSLDVERLVYAGGEWDDSKYKTYPADADNIIPICDDEYFEDDIVGRFIKFIETVYGKETVAENLKFIADALGGKGNPKDVIRKYFLNDFYNDHVKMYQKRPIYWQFDSGKKNGFKCLIYMHRYREDTIARIRTDYVHEQQSRYRTAIVDLEQRINGASTSDRVKLNKQLTKLKDQDTELRGYEEKIHHLADQMLRIDLDDGVKNNYEIFKDVLAKIK